MKIKNILLLSGCLIINTTAMEKENITNDQFRNKQRTLYHQSRENGARETIHKEIQNLFIQAIDSRNATPSTITVDPKFDILGYGIKNNYKELITYCLEQGYSPDNPVFYNNKKMLALAIVSPQWWHLFKKHEANFNITLKDEDHGTLLHKSFHSHPQYLAWLLEQTTLDINQPNGYGNNIGHELSEIFFIGNSEKNEKVFETLKKYAIDPFQKNNNNETPKEIAERIVLAYQKRLAEDPNGINLQAFHYHALKMLSLWQDYEKEYQQTDINKPIKTHCYCENFVHLKKNEIILESQDLPLENIQNAYNFFPTHSRIGSFCKQNPTHSDCVTLAKHYICFNEVYHLTQKREKNWSQCRALEKEKSLIHEQIGAAETKLYLYLSIEEVLALLDNETREKYNTKDQLSTKEQITLYATIREAEENKFGVTNLKNRLDTINKQLEQLRAKPVLDKETKARKKIYGYYSALDFAICSGKSAYHRAVKNLLAMIPYDEEKYIETAKINEGLHNAYHNKKQS